MSETRKPPRPMAEADCYKLKSMLHEVFDAQGIDPEVDVCVEDQCIVLSLQQISALVHGCITTGLSMGAEIGGVLDDVMRDIADGKVPEGIEVHVIEVNSNGEASFAEGPIIRA